MQNYPTTTMNVSKTHLHEEQFSRKTSWKLAETLLYNKAIRKIYTEPSRKRKEAIRSGPVPPGRGLRGKERIHRQRFALGSNWFKPHTGAPVLGADTAKASPFGWLEGY